MKPSPMSTGGDGDPAGAAAAAASGGAAGAAADSSGSTPASSGGSSGSSGSSTLVLVNHLVTPAREYRLPRAPVMDFAALQHLAQEHTDGAESFVLVADGAERKHLTAATFDPSDLAARINILTSVSAHEQDTSEMQIEFAPDHTTITEAGMYEYYASEGHSALTYALCELIDNSLAATTPNTIKEGRHITLRWAEKCGPNEDQNFLLVIDNGCGMTDEELQSWATYHKTMKRRNFTRGRFEERTEDNHCFMNSNISFFGVGGKQASFFIGTGTRMITKTSDSPQVRELTMAKDIFEQRHQAGNNVYEGTILHRPVGALQSHHKLYENIKTFEEENSHFTIAVIENIFEHHATAEKDFDLWCSEFAHIYYYYVHGTGVINRAIEKAISAYSQKHVDLSKRPAPPKVNINMEYVAHNKLEKRVALADVKDDLESKLIETGVETFPFRLEVPRNIVPEWKEVEESTIEVHGILRYHPYLIDHETHPLATPDQDEDVVTENERDFPIFECFWNGRLVPNTRIDTLPFCSLYERNGRMRLPVRRCESKEAYNRLSGTLFMGYPWSVTTNKMTFTADVKDILSHEDVRIRTPNHLTDAGTEWSITHNVERDFLKWLNHCHGSQDVQVSFQGNTKTFVTDKGKTYTKFERITSAQKTYKIGQPVKMDILPKKDILGHISGFLLRGTHEQDNVSGTSGINGRIAVTIWPKTGTGPTIRRLSDLLSKMDEIVLTEAEFKKYQQKESVHFPNSLQVHAKKGTDTFQTTQKVASMSDIGPCEVVVLNGQGQHCKPKHLAGFMVEQIVEQRISDKKSPVVWKQVAHNICKSATTQPGITRADAYYWFDKMYYPDVGVYRMIFKGYTEDSEGSPIQVTHKFSIVANKPDSIDVAMVGDRINLGSPLTLMLEFKDKENNSCPLSDYKWELDITCEKLEFPRSSMKIKKLDNYELELEVSNVLPKKGCIFEQDDEHLELNIVAIDEGIEVVESVEVPVATGLPAKIDFPKEKSLVAVNHQRLPVPHVRVLDKFGFPAFPEREGGEDGPPKKTFTMRIDFSNGQSRREPKFEFEVDRRTGAPKDLSLVMSTQMVKGPLIKKFPIYLASNPNVRANFQYELQPGKEPEALRVLQDGKPVPDHFEELAGAELHLQFVIEDEAGRPIELTTKMLQTVQISWVHGRLLKDYTSSLLKGILPPLKIAEVIDEKNKTLDFDVLYMAKNKNLQQSFSITVQAGAPASLKVNLRESSVAWGKSVPQKKAFELSIVDVHGNVCKSAGLGDSEIVLSAPTANPNLTEMHATLSTGLDARALLHNMSFRPDELGQHMVHIDWHGLHTELAIDVVAGSPSRAVLLNPKPDEDGLISCVEQHQFSEGMSVVLRDEGGNSITTQARSSLELVTSEGLVLLKQGSVAKSAKVSKKGKAEFGVLTASGTPDQEYTFYFKFNTGGANPTVVEMNPTYKLKLISDPNRPSQLTCQYRASEEENWGPLPDDNITIEAGKPLGQFMVQVVCADGSVLQNYDSVAIPKLVFVGAKLAGLTAEFDESESGFVFKDLPRIENAHAYTLKMSCVTANRATLESPEVNVDVVASRPKRLHAEDRFSEPIVTNTEDSNTLLEGLTLKLLDEFDNFCTENIQEYDGPVELKIESKNDAPVPDLEAFPDLVCSYGKIAIPTLKIKLGAACPTNRFQAVISLAGHDEIEPFSFAFNYSNDLENLQRQKELIEEKETLQKYSIDPTEDEISKRKELLEEAREKFHAKQQDHNGAKTAVVRNPAFAEIKTHVAGLKTLKDAEAALDVVDDVEASSQQAMPANRFKTVEPYTASGTEQHAVVGFVGNLAFVEDDDMNRILSNHLSSRMRVLVTTKATTAEALASQYRVLPTETMQPGHQWPKAVTKDMAEFGGNYLLNSVKFPRDQAAISMQVFSALVGSTMVFPDISSGNKYRIKVKGKAPTIYTRDFFVIDGSGIFSKNGTIAGPDELTYLFPTHEPRQLGTMFTSLRRQLSDLVRFASEMEQSEREYRELGHRLDPELKQLENDLEKHLARRAEIERELGSLERKRKDGDTHKPAKRTRKR